jgi:hypothetical protein
MKIFKRFLKEFTVPLILSIIWAFYKRDDLPSDTRPDLYFVGNLSAAFFFTSWITSQFFRIGKQHFVEDHLVKVLEDIKGYTTGADSFFYYKVKINLAPGWVLLDAVYEGKYPLTNGMIRIVTSNSNHKRHLEEFKSIDSKNVRTMDQQVRFLKEDGGAINETTILFYANSKSWVQRISHTVIGDEISVTSNLYMLDGEWKDYTETYSTPLLNFSN